MAKKKKCLTRADKSWKKWRQRAYKGYCGKCMQYPCVCKEVHNFLHKHPQEESHA
jgi:hypothetical protein